jgi:putative membrane protein
MLWVKAFHIVSMVAWFAALFYLPRIFVYHASAPSGPVHEQFCVMERRLYRAIMTPAMVLTVVLGLWLLAAGWGYLSGQLWLWIKLVLVAGLIGYHFFCGRLVRVFAAGANTRPHTFYRFFNEVPTLVLIAVVILAVVRPL